MREQLHIFVKAAWSLAEQSQLAAEQIGGRWPVEPGGEGRR
ncbi:MAG TPA: hypothetical protein VEY08_15275 [Chloroflexia bacterium]|nr:hypothetical protein [Chloroflexia bacterium]